MFFHRKRCLLPSQFKAEICQLFWSWTPDLANADSVWNSPQCWRCFQGLFYTSCSGNQWKTHSTRASHIPSAPQNISTSHQTALHRANKKDGREKLTKEELVGSGSHKMKQLTFTDHRQVLHLCIPVDLDVQHGPTKFHTYHSQETLI